MRDPILSDSMTRAHDERPGAVQVDRKQVPQDTSAYFRSLTENASELGVVLAPEGSILYASPSTERVSGIPAGRLVGTRYADLVHPADQEAFVSGLREVAGTVPGTAVVQHRFRAAGGGWRTVESSLRSDPGQSVAGGIVVNSRDITDAEDARVRLEAYAAELERSNVALQEFASIASHDLQEPLRKIRAFGDRLKASSAGWLDSRSADYVERMQDAAGRMQILVKELLNYSRLAVQRSTPTRVDLGALTAEVLMDLQEPIRETGALVDVQPLLPVVCDPTQIRQLLQNLIGNALKFHRAGASPRVRVDSTLLPGGMVEIRVSDDGIGFAEKYVDRIFQPFERLHAREDYEGTGMGLAICRRIAEQNGGAIRATSTAGEGSMFFVILPTDEDTWTRATHRLPGRSPSS